MNITHKDLTKMLQSGQSSHNLPLKWSSSSSGTFSLIIENFPGLPFFINLPPTKWYFHLNSAPLWWSTISDDPILYFWYISN